MTKELADETNSEHVRMTAAILTKNFIANKGGVSLIQLNLDFFVRIPGMRIIGLTWMPSSRNNLKSHFYHV